MTDKKGPAPRTAEGHRRRLREKFLRFGLDKFTDDEVVELLLTLATPRRDCKLTARRALERFGSFPAVLEASADELQKVEGIGPANVFGIRLIHSIARKFLRERILEENYVNSFDEVLDYFTHALRDQKREYFHVLFLNSQNAILHEESLSAGGPASVAVTPRELMEKALAHSATTLVLAHNHPGGSTRPSAEDAALTREMVFAAGFLDLRIREHIIISSTGHYSFMREGLIGQFEEEFERFYEKLTGGRSAGL